MSIAAETKTTQTFLKELHEQRWDDHRYYHQSRVNQSLHLLSACSFLSTYVLMFINPIAAAFMGWVVAMLSRQVGHFFFEPKGYDVLNQASHHHKEEIKVGYNLERKVYLLSAWALTPVLIYMQPTLWGVLEVREGWYGFLWNLSLLWILLGITAVVARTAFLSITREWKTGLVWAVKIITDPIHDIMLYHKAPLALLRGEWIDPMDDVRARQ